MRSLQREHTGRDMSICRRSKLDEGNWSRPHPTTRRTGRRPGTAKNRELRRSWVGLGEKYKEGNGMLSPVHRSLIILLMHSIVWIESWATFSGNLMTVKIAGLLATSRNGSFRVCIAYSRGYSLEILLRKYSGLCPCRACLFLRCIASDLGEKRGEPAIRNITLEVHEQPPEYFITLTLASLDLKIRCLGQNPKCIGKEEKIFKYAAVVIAAL